MGLCPPFKIYSFVQISKAGFLNLVVTTQIWVPRIMSGSRNKDWLEDFTTYNNICLSSFNWIIRTSHLLYTFLVFFVILVLLSLFVGPVAQSV